MRGPSKALPKYRKHRATGQGIVTLSGTDIYLGPHGTKARTIGAWLANGRGLPTETSSTSIPIIELCAAYLQHAKAYYVKNGKVTDEVHSMKMAIRHDSPRFATIRHDSPPKPKLRQDERRGLWPAGTGSCSTTNDRPKAKAAATPRNRKSSTTLPSKSSCKWTSDWIRIMSTSTKNRGCGNMFSVQEPKHPPTSVPICLALANSCRIFGVLTS